MSPGRCIWGVCFDSHDSNSFRQRLLAFLKTLSRHRVRRCFLQFCRGLQARENLDLLAVCRKLDNRLFGLRRFSEGHAASLGLAVQIHCVHAGNLRAREHLFNRFLNLILCCIRQNKPTGMLPERLSLFFHGYPPLKYIFIH